MTVHDAINAAEQLLPGVVAPDGAQDPRWQGIIAVGAYVETEPDAVWAFAQRWAGSPDPDLRDAIATCLLEHLLEHHFERIFPRVEAAVRAAPLVADCFARCWAFGQAAEPPHRARFDELKQRVHAV